MYEPVSPTTIVPVPPGAMVMVEGAPSGSVVTDTDGGTTVVASGRRVSVEGLPSGSVVTAVKGLPVAKMGSTIVEPPRRRVLEAGRVVRIVLEPSRIVTMAAAVKRGGGSEAFGVGDA